MDGRYPLGPLQLSSQEIEELYLSCSQCQENFLKKHDLLAYLLPCLHTVCSECVSGLNQTHSTKIDCFVCKESHEFHSDDITKTIPVDHTRPDLRDFICMHKFPHEICCTPCNDDGVKAYSRCTECAEFLCADCTAAHTRTTTTQCHDVREISKLKDAHDLEVFHTLLRCPAHKENNRENSLTLFCSKETCQKPICFLCRFISCKESDGHTILDLKEATASSKFYMEDEIKKIQITRRELQRVKSVVESEIEEMDGCEVKLEASIDSTIDEMINKLETRRHELKSDLMNRTEIKRETLRNQKRALAERQRNIDQGLQFAKQALCSTNDAAFLQIDKTIMDRLYRLNHDPFDRKPHERALVCFLFSKANLELQRLLTENLKVWSTSVFSPNTTFNVPGDVKENRQTKMLVFLRDHQKRPVEMNALENVTITVADPAGTLQCTHFNQCIFL